MSIRNKTTEAMRGTTTSSPLLYGILLVCLCISTSFSDSSSSSAASSSIASSTGNASITTQPIISSNASSIATNDNSTSTDGPVKRLMTRLIHDQNTLLQASSVLLLLVFLA